MNKKVDLELINSRSREREDIIQNGKFFETLESEGKTPEGIKKAAKEILGLPDDGIILLEANEIMKKKNRRSQSLVLFLNSTSSLEDLNLTDDEVSVILSVRGKVELELCSTFDVDLEDLYVEGDQ